MGRYTSGQKSGRGVGALARAVVDVLEPRRLFAAGGGGGGGSVALSPDGTLVVTGTEKSDQITVSLAKGDPTKLDVKIGRVTSQFAVADVTGGVVIKALGGNDVITVSERNGAIDLDVSVFAGGGNDKVVLGSGDDVVDAGAGNDDVRGGAGDDFVTGGAGNDKLDGGGDDDSLVGGAGNDKLMGSGGDDDLEGSGGNDNLDGAAGDDDLVGDDGNDKLNGGAGDDDLLGGDGKDALSGGMGDDYCDGGEGKDSVRGDKGEDRFGDDDDDAKDRRGDDRAALTFDALPEAVRSAVRAEFPTGELLKIGAEDGAGDGAVTEYQFLIVADGLRQELVVSPDGTFLKQESEDRATPLTLSDLPELARTDFASRFSGATLLKLGAEDGAGNDVITEYELKFLFDGKLHELKYDASGGVTSLESEDDGPVTVESLPAALVAAFNTVYPGATILKLGSEDGAGGGVVTEYTLRFAFGGTTYEAKYNPAGTLLRIEQEDGGGHGGGGGGSHSDDD